jgi:2'-5' RNA ligase superfamily
MIKKYQDFLESKSSKLYDYGCVMIYPTIENWSEITSIIHPDDVYNPSATYGIEIDPHITLLYGLHPEVTHEQIGDVLNKFKGNSFGIDINGIGKFDNKDFSVVKFNIDSPILHEINHELTKLPHTTDYPNYVPHMTIAYVKPGSADKYLSGDYRKTFNNVNKVVYSMTDGNKIPFQL